LNSTNDLSYVIRPFLHTIHHIILLQPHASLPPPVAFIITSFDYSLCFPTFLLLICEISSTAATLVEEVIQYSSIHIRKNSLCWWCTSILVLNAFYWGTINPCCVAVQTEKFMSMCSAQETVTISLKTIDTDSLYYVVYNINRYKKKDSNKFQLVVLALIVTYVFCYSRKWYNWNIFRKFITSEK
jgi:hypothetical protein